MKFENTMMKFTNLIAHLLVINLVLFALFIVTSFIVVVLVRTVGSIYQATLIFGLETFGCVVLFAISAGITELVVKLNDRKYKSFNAQHGFYSINAKK